MPLFCIVKTPAAVSSLVGQRGPIVPSAVAGPFGNGLCFAPGSRYLHIGALSESLVIRQFTPLVLNVELSGNGVAWPQQTIRRLTGALPQATY